MTNRIDLSVAPARCLSAVCLSWALLFCPASGMAQQSAEAKAKALEHKAAAFDPAQPAPAETLTAPQAQALDPSGAQPLDDPLTCLARTIYWEAKGEPEAGMQAIANVVMNRLGREEFPATVCGVVKQGQEQGACQFSWWCDGRGDEVEETEPYTLAKEIARRALNQQLPDRSGGALYFHRRDVNPQWAAQYRQTAAVGQHLFYKPAGGAAK